LRCIVAEVSFGSRRSELYAGKLQKTIASNTRGFDRLPATVPGGRAVRPGD
jgi:hypothetical protein